MSVDIGGGSIDIETIIDIFIFLTITIIAIYLIFKSKNNNKGKSDDYIINNEPGIDDKKGLVIKDIKKNWQEYKNIKTILKSTILFFFTIIIARMTIIGIIGLYFSLYNLLTDKFDSLELYHTFIFIILLSFCILYITFAFKQPTIFGNNELNINFFHKFIIILLILLIFFRFSYSILFLIFFLLDKLNMEEISFIIEYYFVFLTIGIGISIGLLTISRLFFLKHPSENDGHMAIDNVPINDEKIGNSSIDKALTYDELIDNNKKIEKKTGFHQGPLLE